MNEPCDIIQEALGDIQQDLTVKYQSRLEPEVYAKLDRMLEDIQRYLSSVQWRPDYPPWKSKE